MTATNHVLRGPAPALAFGVLLMVAAAALPGAGGAEPVQAPATDLADLSLEELMNVEVYGASKFSQKLSQAPSSVSIITGDDIRKYGYRTVMDILRSVRSFYSTDDRNYTYIAVRGFGRPGDYNTRVLLLVDGHRTNDNIYNSIAVGTDGVLDVDLIERIEVIRGPGSSLYGSNAFFAVVNVITRRGRDVQGVEVSGAAGSYGTYSGRVTAGGRSWNGLEALVSGTGYNSEGQELYFREFDPAFSTDPRAANNGIADHADYDRSKSFFTKASFRDFILEGAYSSRTKGIPTGSYGTDFNDPGNKTTDERAYADLTYEHGLGARTDLAATLYYDYYSYHGDFLYGGAPNKDEVYGSWWGGDLKLTTRAFEAHRIVVGTEYQDNLKQDQKNYDVVPYTLYTDDKRASRHGAVYAEDEITLSKTLVLNAGVRYDHYDTFGGTTNPRIALIYAPGAASSVKLLYGTAFRAPNVYELYYSAPISVPPQAPNPNLQPETITTYELVYEQYLGDSFRWTVDGYSYQIKDLIDLTTDAAGNLVYENTAKVRTRGVELELEKKWMNGPDVRFSYSYQHSEDVATGEVLTNSPENLAKLNIAVPVVRSKIFAGIEEQYTGRRKTVNGTYAPGFFITNLTLFSRNLIERLDLSGSVYNLFDTSYSDPVSEEHQQNTIEQDGRTFRVKLTYRF